MNICILFRGRGHLFKRFPVTRDTLCMGFALPKEIWFFLLGSFAILIGNLSSKVISTINFHTVFRSKLAVVSLLLLRPEFGFIDVKSFPNNFWTVLDKIEILSLKSRKRTETNVLKSWISPNWAF